MCFVVYFGRLGLQGGEAMRNPIMRREKHTRGRAKASWPLFAQIGAVLIAGALFAWWMAARVDRELRADLLQQTRLVAQAVNVVRVQALSGTEADLDNPDYLRLKKQLAAVRSANPQCRFVYLMGRRADGAVFYFVDSESAGSKDYSPPGRVYDEASEEFRRIFDTKTEAVEGPITDHWDTWVSALVPLSDPQSGEILAVLRMDIDARTWKWEVAARAALPVGSVLVLLIGVAAFFAAVRRVDASPKPVLRRLLPPLVAMVILLMAGAGALLWQQQSQRLAADIAAQIATASRELRVDLDNQAAGLAAAAHIAADATVQKALREGDTGRLLIAWRPVFETLRRENHLTHFSFFDANRVCLLRVHKPETRGDLINRFTALEAERTGKTASGIELGVLGAFSLRVVQPIFEGGRLAGYLELGKEIEDVLQARRDRAGLELAVVIGKEHLDRQAWEDGMRLLGRQADWERLPRSIVSYASQGRLPDAFASWADPAAGEHARRETDREIAAGGKDWRVSATPLPDASGKDVGDLLVMRDITADKAAFARLLALGGTAGGVLLALLLTVVYILLRRTDAGIRAQQANLRESEEHLSATLRSIGDGVISTDAAGQVASLNSVAERLTGWTTAEAKGRPIAEVFRIIHAKTRARAENPVERALREGVVVDLANHTALIARDGAEYQIADSCAPIHDAAGVVIGAVLVFRDVTGEYRRREQLRESEARFNELAEQSGTVAWEVDAQGLYTYVSHVAEAVWGYRPDELVGRMHFYDLHPEEGREAFKKAALAAFERKEPFQNLDNAAQAKDGRVVWVSTNGIPLLNADGTLRGYHGSDTDITERKRAEEALRESNEYLENLFNYANAPIIVWDLQFRITRFNRAFEVLTGRSATFVLGEDIRILFPTDRVEGSMDLIRNTLGGERWETVEIPIARADGALCTVLWNSATIFAADGETPVAAIAQGQDITERKHAEELIQRHMSNLEAARDALEKNAADLARMVEALGLEKERAEAATRAKSEFLANMSHEIRTPMNGVIGMTGLLLDTELNEEQRRYAGIVRASGESLLGVINDILDFSKIEAKKLDLETMDFDLESMLDDFAATLAVRAYEKGLELICAAGSAVPTLLRGDPGRLRQILTNLAGNAVKFTQKGEVAVRVSMEEERETECLLRFSVRDTGIGIPEHKIGLLFDKFSQVDASTTRKYGGTGLGLAISKQLAELMGGEVGVESEGGKGSEFWFTARLGKQPEGARTESLPPADLRGVRVLIVDDNATSREILTTRTTSWGMRPSEVEDGPEALQALYRALEENDPFRVAVIDMQMPEMDGETLGRAIQADRRLADTRMVMLTSLGTRGDARHFEEIGFAAYATKPIRHQELLGVLSLALAERGGTQLTPRPIATRHAARETLNLYAGRKALILVAEDNIVNQHVALGILKKFGLRADAVANGAEAVKALETIPYDLVLMDVQMPVMDGLEATREIRNPQSKVGSHAIPIIAMTAYAMQGDRERCVEAGMNDYVSKPVLFQALTEVLARWLPKKDDESGMLNAGETPPLILHSSLPVVFDRAGMLERLMNDEDLAQVVMESFLDDIPRQIEALRRYLDAWDAPSAERQAHTIKGASANVGGEALRALAFEMEKAGKAGDLGSVRARMDDLEREFVRLKEAMAIDP
jgi:PAS domain S-box-containing protein